MTNQTEQIVIEKLSLLSKSINQLDSDLSDVQERISLGVTEAYADYQAISHKFMAVKTDIHKLQTEIAVRDTNLYLLFLDIKSCFNALKNKLEFTRYFKVLFDAID